MHPWPWRMVRLSRQHMVLSDIWVWKQTCQPPHKFVIISILRHQLSIVSSKTRDALFAKTLSTPGICETESHSCFSLYHIQISIYYILDWEPPILRRYSTAVVLSVRILMWQFEEVLHDYCKHRNTALSSAYLISCSFFTLDHLFPAVVCSVVAPHPRKKASLFMIKLILPWFIAFLESNASVIHHCMSDLALSASAM